MTIMIRLSRGSQKSFNFPPPKFGLLRVSLTLHKAPCKRLLQPLSICWAPSEPQSWVVRATQAHTHFCTGCSLLMSLSRTDLGCLSIERALMVTPTSWPSNKVCDTLALQGKGFIAAPVLRCIRQ